MSIVAEERASDSPYLAGVTYGHTLAAGTSIRPAEVSWHMVFVRVEGKQIFFVVGPWASSGIVSYGAGAEILWLRFKLGSFMPHMPTRRFANSEIMLPDAVNQSFWLDSLSWECPSFENVECFVNRLVRENVLVQDKLVHENLAKPNPDISERTLRHRFLQATGLSQGHIQQVARAQEAVKLLEEGCSILDTAYTLGYFDQAHMTKSLRRFIGYTPAQIIRRSSKSEVLVVS